MRFQNISINLPRNDIEFKIFELLLFFYFGKVLKKMWGRKFKVVKGENIFECVKISWHMKQSDLLLLFLGSLFWWQWLFRCWKAPVLLR